MRFREYRYKILSDLYRITADIRIITLIKSIMIDGGFQYTFWMRTCAYTRKNNLLKYTLHPFAKVLLSHYKYKFGISIPYTTKIGNGFYIGHFTGIIISHKSVIGHNCNISHGVTLGQANRGPKKGYPILGNNVYIGPGAKIVGAVTIGNNVAIGANCVVTKNIPDNAVVVGIPGRVISKNGAEEYSPNTDYNEIISRTKPSHHDSRKPMEIDKSNFKSYINLSDDFFEKYYTYHTTGQYEGVGEFSTVDECRLHPPNREKDNYYCLEIESVNAYRQLATSEVLELGCGDGNLTWKLAQRCKNLTCIDIDDNAINTTKQRLKDLNIDNVNLSCQDILSSSIGKKFDVVFFVQVLEHVPKSLQKKMFDIVCEAVAPGGALYISTPNQWDFCDGHDTGKYFIHWLPRPIKTRIAQFFGWGAIIGHDPSWDTPPILHDYVSYRWMWKLVQKNWSSPMNSKMTYHTTAKEWLQSKNQNETSSVKKYARIFICGLSAFLPMNYYFGNKVVFWNKDKQK